MCQIADRARVGSLPESAPPFTSSYMFKRPPTLSGVQEAADPACHEVLQGVMAGRVFRLGAAEWHRPRGRNFPSKSLGISNMCAVTVVRDIIGRTLSDSDPLGAASGSLVGGILQLHSGSTARRAQSLPY